MSTIKPGVEQRAALMLLEERFDGPVTGLQSIAGGLVAQAFGFSAGGQDYIIRFNIDNMDANYEKEAYISKHYGSASVPIPRVVAVGRLRELRYCITRRAIGQRLDQLSAEATERAMPSVIATLDAIREIDVSRQKGYGLFDGRGRGLFSSWPASLRRVRDEERPEGFYGRWHALFETTFLEREAFDDVYAHMESLLGYAPDSRHFVHGGYGFGNVLVADDRVTAVIDWLDAKYGDFLYDLAWLDYWDPGRGYRERFWAHYAERDVDVPHFDQRLLCYACYIALDGFRFFAKSGDGRGYRWTRDRITGLIGA